MAEPPHKRARRPDSKQMWDEADKRAPMPSRERDEPRERERRDERDRKERDDQDRERNRRYRSRSPREPRETRMGRDRGGRDVKDARDSRGGRRDDRDMRSGKGERRDKGRERAAERGEYMPSLCGLSFAIRGGRPNAVPKDSARESRGKPRERSRSRDREAGKRMARSRSPRRERERDGKREEEKPKALKPEEDITKSRTATPPVSFKVHGARASSHDAVGGQDHDRMEVDGDVKAKGKKASKAKAKKVEEDVEGDDDDIIIEDDSMAAMQAMMGFGGFGSTHQQKVAGNDVYAVRKEKKTEYRQYMNRVGGFNRPLSPTREG